MRQLGHSLIAQLLLVTLAMPSYAYPPLKRRTPKPDPRQRLVQPLIKPVLPFVDPGPLQPDPSLNPELAQTIKAAVAAGQLTDPNTFKKSTPLLGSVPGINGKGGSGKGSSGGGNGSGNGGGSGTSGGAFSYNSGGGNNGGGNNNGGGRPPREGTGSQSGGAKAFDKWYPMCLFIGEHVSQADGNAAVKGLIDQAAKCFVNLVVFPVTTKNIPGTSDAINAAQTAACNLQDAFGSLGVTNASTSTCAPQIDIAGEMCKQPNPKRPQVPYWDPSVKGCAVLAKANEDLEQGLRNFFIKNTADGVNDRRFQDRLNELRDDLKMVSGASGVLPSIEERDSCTPNIVGHEALGHSMWGHPNGSSDGNGIGFSLEKQDGEGGGGSGWSDDGCAAMRGKAYGNADRRWKYDPNRTQYYSKINDPAKQWDLQGGGRLFGAAPGPPPPGPQQRPRGDGGPQQITYDEGGGKNPGVRRVGRGDGGNAGGGASAAGSPPSAPAPDSPPGDLAIAPPSIHKRKQPQIIDEMVAKLAAIKAPQDDGAPPPNTVPPPPGPPPPPGKPAPSTRLEYDESAGKARPPSSGGGEFQKAIAGSPPPSEGGGFTTSVDYDESAPKNAASAGGGGKTAIGYDESAAKGGGSFSSNVIRMGSAVSEAPPPAPSANTSLGSPGGPAGLAGATVKLNPIGASFGSGLSSDFFKDSDESDEEKKDDPRRRRRPSAGAAIRRAPASLTEGAPVRSLRDQGGGP